MATIGNSPAEAWDKYNNLMNTDVDKYAKNMGMAYREGRELSIFKTATGQWEVGFFNFKPSDDYKKKVYTDLTNAEMPQEVAIGTEDKYKGLREIRNKAQSELAAISSKGGGSGVAQPVQSKPIPVAQYLQNQKNLRSAVGEKLKQMHPGKNQLVQTDNGMATTPQGGRELEAQRKALHELIIQLGTGKINEPVDETGNTLLDIATKNRWVGDNIIQDLVERGAKHRSPPAS